MKTESIFSCQACGAQYHKWCGRCFECGKWGTLQEESTSLKDSSASADSDVSPVTFSTLQHNEEHVCRETSGSPEFDRICGGGIVRGTSILIGGNPGIGKSTMLLQILSGLASRGKDCVYFSGEESVEQICIRAQRLGLAQANIKLASETCLEKILASLTGQEDFVVIDSVQTLSSVNIESFSGSVNQIKACTNSLIHHSKKHNTTIFLIGHVNKEGSLAGPKFLEHMVDTVLYFEEEASNAYRILRANKNRYGPCDEIAIFRMQGGGLESVENSSSLFMSKHTQALPGCVVFAGIQGNRPMMLEIQSLVSKSYTQTPRRTVVGWDINRLFMLLAVLENKAGTTFYDRDVYLSITGGIRVNEPAADLAVAASLLSARNNTTIATNTCMFGEIGLIGEVRPTHRESDRIKEAQKLGFENIYANIDEQHKSALKSIKIHNISSIQALAQCLK